MYRAVLSAVAGRAAIYRGVCGGFADYSRHALLKRRDRRFRDWRRAGLLRVSRFLLSIEKRANRRFVRIADDEATRTIGAVGLRGRSLTRVYRAFLAHPRAARAASPS